MRNRKLSSLARGASFAIRAAKPRIAIALLILGSLAFVRSSTAAVQHPTADRGFAPAQAYAYGDVDHVNLYNGALTLTIPVGPTYRVGRGLSYGLTLVYNSKLWDWELECELAGCPAVAWANRDANAGFGWQLSLGRLVPPLTPPRNDTSRWLYISPDGAEHSFYDTLGNEAPVADVYYTRDSTYLRLKKAGNLWELEHPDGEIHTFDASGRLTRREDRFGNFLNVSYAGNVWTLSDSTQRSHTVTFTDRLMDGDFVPHVTEVDLAAFNGQRAVWSFSYERALVERPDPSPQVTGYIGTDVHFLTGISLPEGLSYAMPVANYHRLRSEHPLHVGQIKAMDLASGGSVEWDYTAYFFYNLPGSPPVGFSPPANQFRTSSGVGKRRLRDVSGAQLGEWIYSQRITTEVQEASVESVTEVEAPSGHKTVHYFSTYQGGPTSIAAADELELGLPFTPKVIKGGRRLSQEVYSSTGGHLRTVEVRYERDTAAHPSAPYIERDRNRRRYIERTIFEDDGRRFKNDRNANFDGLGNYRKMVRSGNLEGVNGRTEFTNYNPGGMPSSSESWILGTFDYQTTFDSGQATLRRDTCFDPKTGFLKVERLRKINPSPGANDVVQTMEYTRTGTTETVVERHFGGDLAAVPTQTNPCSVAPNPTTSQVALEHLWRYGTEQSTRYMNANGTRLPFFELDQTVDRDSGLVASSRSRDGQLTTTYDYDELGRLKTKLPPSGHGAKVTYTHVNPSSTSGARVIAQASDRNTNALLAKSELIFDGLGRVKRERQRQPGPVWALRDTTYSGEGWVTAQSEWRYPAATTYWTAYEHDAFGRVTKMTPPDGSSHDIDIDYFGERRVRRTYRVGTSVAGNGTVQQTAHTSEELYDRHGRLVKVIEPAGGLTATYLYDSADRLKVATFDDGGLTQTRSFTHDGRGFMTGEDHPESQPIVYGLLDARGKPGRRVQAGTELLFSYDRAERPTLLREGSSGDRVLKQWTYSNSNSGANLRKGKLEKAVRHNYVESPVFPGVTLTAVVTETLTYAGRDGRVSNRRTQTTVDGTPGVDFSQSWVYDGLGQATQIGYPRCASCPPVTAPPANKSFSYSHGYLTAIPGYASALNYHPSGMIEEITRTNGLTDHWAADLGRARPSEIRVSGPFANTLGMHSYDGVGSLVRRQVPGILDNRYTYDALRRIKSFEDSSGNQGYQYDSFGNLEAITGANARSIGVNSSNNQLTGLSSYDGRGNLLTWGSQEYRYDALDRVTAKNYPDETYVYTADDERLWTFRWSGDFDSLTESWTVRDLDGKVLSIFENPKGTTAFAWTRDYVYRGNALVATDTPQAGVLAKHHFSLDHLGSPRLITSQAGGVVAAHHYYPYGEEVASSNDTEVMRFTGHERDFGGGTFDLDYMHARYYSPHLGRFLSMDPVLGSLQLPQSWNAYQYALGNPLTLTDPSGRSSDCNLDDGGTTINCGDESFNVDDAIEVTSTLNKTTGPTSGGFNINYWLWSNPLATGRRGSGPDAIDLAQGVGRETLTAVRKLTIGDTSVLRCGGDGGLMLYPLGASGPARIEKLAFGGIATLAAGAGGFIGDVASTPVRFLGGDRIAPGVGLPDYSVFPVTRAATSGLVNNYFPKVWADKYDANCQPIGK